MSTETSDGQRRRGSKSAPALIGAMDGPTPVGVDIGSTRHLFVATTPRDGPGNALTVEASYVAALFAEFQSATHRLGAAPAYDDDCLGDLVARYWPRIRTALERAAENVVEYAAAHPSAVLVVEDLPQRPRTLVDAANGGVRLASWIPPVARAVIVDVAAEAGLPIASVDPHETSRKCHVCGERGELLRDVLACSAPNCPVDEVCRDRSAAATIAKRVMSVTV